MSDKPEYNKNGCVSGGFIFDQMDKFGHDCVAEKFPDKYVFTENANVAFLKQVCNWKDVHLTKSTCLSDGNTVQIQVALAGANDEHYALGYFIFKLKDHAYCLNN